LGSFYDLVNLSIKPYPSCRYPHASIDAALSLVRRGTFSADEIEKINVYLPPATHGIVGGPFEIKGNPTVDAQFSVPYCVAAAILRKDIFIPDFEEKLVREPKVIELAGKVVCYPDESIPGKAIVPVRLEVILKNGKVEKERVDAMKGSPQNPMTYEEVISKFQKCLPYAVKRFSEEKMFKVADLIKKLEVVKDIDEIVKSMLC
jgi:2-methylcitrate dehydratase PrpD